jgi:hypothetical protein
MNYARVVVAVLNDDVEAASGEDPKNCPKFEATLKIFSKFSSPNPESGLLRKIAGEVIKGFNRNERTYDKDQEVILGQLIDETWIIIESVGGGCEWMIVKIDDVYQSGSSVDDHCDNQLNDAKDRYKATCLYSCCGSTPSGANDDGTYTVVDLVFGMLQGGIGGAREQIDVIGKEALVVRMIECDNQYDDVCEWHIVFINWFRTVQVVTNVIMTATELKFEMKNVEVWDDCELDPIVIPLTDCEESYTG